MVCRAFQLRELGKTTREIADELNAGTTTVWWWFHRGLEATVDPYRVEHAGGLCPSECPRRAGLDEYQYAHLLGQYLGDGWIGKPVRGVHRRACSRSTVPA